MHLLWSSILMSGIMPLLFCCLNFRMVPFRMHELLKKENGPTGYKSTCSTLTQLISPLLRILQNSTWNHNLLNRTFNWLCVCDITRWSWVMQLYLSTTNITSSKTLQAKSGSVPWPPCRYNIVSFTKQQHHQEQELYVLLQLLCSSDVLDTAQSSTLTIVICKPVVSRTSSRTSQFIEWWIIIVSVS